MLNFDQNHLKMFGTDENCLKIQGGKFPSNFCQNVVLMGEKHSNNIRFEEKKPSTTTNIIGFEKITPTQIQIIFSFKKVSNRNTNTSIRPQVFVPMHNGDHITSPTHAARLATSY